MDDGLPTQLQSDCHENRAYKHLFGEKKKIETPYIKHYSPNKRVSSTILQELPKSLLKGLERMWDIGQSRSLGPLLVHSFTYEWVHAASSLPGAKCYAKC